MTMLYSRFKDEATFRSDFIRPLLTRLGYVGIAELHGQHKFGKDFVFAELTPFGFLKYHAAVVKHEESISQSNTRLLDTVLSQIRQAFAVKFRLSDSASEHSVSSVFVFNSGKTTDNAKTYLRSELARERFGDNVHIFDGERLSQLDLTATIQESRTYLPRLQGLINEIGVNTCVCESIRESLGTYQIEVRGTFTRAMEDFLVAPFLSPPIELNNITQLVQACRIIDATNRRLNSKLTMSGGFRDQNITTLTKMIERVCEISKETLSVLRKLLRQFAPLSGQSFTVSIEHEDNL